MVLRILSFGVFGIGCALAMRQAMRCIDMKRPGAPALLVVSIMCWAAAWVVMML